MRRARTVTCLCRVGNCKPSLNESRINFIFEERYLVPALYFENTAKLADLPLEYVDPLSK